MVVNHKVFKPDKHLWRKLELEHRLRILSAYQPNSARLFNKSSDIKSLILRFASWSSTKEGPGYWSDVYRCYEKLNDTFPTTKKELTLKHDFYLDHEEANDFKSW